MDLRRGAVIWAVVAATAGAAQAASYAYDPLGRLVSVINDDGSQVIYTYDAAGNRTAVTNSTTTTAPFMTAHDDSYTFYNGSGSPITFDPRVNDSDPTATLVGVSSPTFGSATNNGNNTISYTGPASHIVQTDAFSYTVRNAAGIYASAVVTISLNTSAPIAGPVNANVLEDSNANGIPPNLSGSPATSLAIYSSPTNGWDAVYGLSLVYTPFPGYTGSDSFQYTATNSLGLTSSPATVYVNVSLIAPIVGNANTSVPGQSGYSPLNLSLSGGAATSVAVVSPPASGSYQVNGTSITYSPNYSFAGSDSLQYTASNSAGTSNTATAYITVLSTSLVANPITATVYSNTSNNVIPTNITGGMPLGINIVGTPAGTATTSGTNIVYTPPPGTSGGSDSFQYDAYDGNGTSTPGSVNITINPTLTATLNTYTWTWTQFLNETPHIIPTTAVTCSTGGGSGTISTWQWIYVSGSTFIQVNQGYSPTTSWSLTGGAAMNTKYSANWICQATDSQGHVAQSPAVTVNMTHNNNQ